VAVYDFDVGSRKFTNLDVEAAIKRFGVGSRHRWSGNESAQEVLDTIASTRNLSIDELLEILGRDKERTFMTLEGLKLPRRLILRVWNHIKSNKATTATANESNNMSKFAHMNLEAIAAWRWRHFGKRTSSCLPSGGKAQMNSIWSQRS
jgi:hypothetical protein